MLLLAIICVLLVPKNSCIVQTFRLNVPVLSKSHSAVDLKTSSVFFELLHIQSPGNRS